MNSVKRLEGEKGELGDRDTGQGQSVKQRHWQRSESSPKPGAKSFRKVNKQPHTRHEGLSDWGGELGFVAAPRVISVGLSPLVT